MWHPIKKEEEEDNKEDSRPRVASVTTRAIIFRVRQSLLLCLYEKTTRQKKETSAPRARVRSTPVLRRVFLYVLYREQKKESRETFLYRSIGEKVNTKNMTSFPLLAFFLVFVVAPTRDALVVRCEEEEERRRTAPVVLPRVAWSMREKRCIDQTPFASKGRSFREDGFVLEKVVPTFTGAEELAMWSNAAKRRGRVACDDEEEEDEAQTRRDDDALAAIVDAVLKKQSVELKPKEHLYVNTSSMVSTFDGNSITTTVQKRGGSFEITYVPTSNMRRANASNVSTIWTIEDSFENYVSNDVSTAAVGARESRPMAGNASEVSRQVRTEILYGWNREPHERCDCC